jgi:succinate-semialdehyde dehydrogenase / glutarate-semialdehyde dehydrogenase
MVTRKIAPALAAGCTVVLKSPGETPFSANALAVLAVRAGVPKGVINIVTALENTPQIGQALCYSNVVRKISFTGSTRVGRLLMSQSSGTIKKLSLELGGNAPFIVFDDADMDVALNCLVAAKFKSSGQTCVCANRVYVHKNILEDMMKRLVKAVEGFKVGAGSDPSTTHGPLISAAAVARVDALVQDATGQGAKVVVGGKRRSDLGTLRNDAASIGAILGTLDANLQILSGSNFYEPTILTDVTDKMAIFHEEIFGPVATILPFDDEDQVIDAANRCDVGLASYIYTRDMARATRVSELLQAGMVAINTGAVSDSAVP